MSCRQGRVHERGDIQLAGVGDDTHVSGHGDAALTQGAHHRQGAVRGGAADGGELDVRPIQPAAEKLIRAGQRVVEGDHLTIDQQLIGLVDTDSPHSIAPAGDAIDDTRTGRRLIDDHQDLLVAQCRQMLDELAADLHVSAAHGAHVEPRRRLLQDDHRPTRRRQRRQQMFRERLGGRQQHRRIVIAQGLGQLESREAAIADLVEGPVPLTPRPHHGAGDRLVVH